MEFKFNHEEENLRVIDLAQNNRVFLTREDPYGFWKVSFEKGKVPVRLQDNFTTVEAALKLVLPYLEQKNKDIVKVS